MSRAHLSATNSQRRTIAKVDLTNAVDDCELFDFLVDLVPPDGVNEDSDNKEVKGRKPKTAKKVKTAKAPTMPSHPRQRRGMASNRAEPSTAVGQFLGDPSSGWPGADNSALQHLFNLPARHVSSPFKLNTPADQVTDLVHAQSSDPFDSLFASDYAA